VRTGSQGRGGWPYQLLAVGLTYLSIVLAYAVLIHGELGAERIERLGNASWLAVLLIAIVAPFAQGWGSILSALIIGFGLFEAWRSNRRGSIDWSGPHLSSERRVHSSLPPLPGSQPPPLPPPPGEDRG
jgi:hypothetical protein